MPLYEVILERTKTLLFRRTVQALNPDEAGEICEGSDLSEWEEWDAERINWDMRPELTMELDPQPEGGDDES